MLNDEPYFKFVMQEAEKSGKMFVLDVGEGRDYIDERTGWYIEDFSGWLILPQDHERFTASRENGNAYEEFGDEYVFAIWTRQSNGNVEVEFKKY